MPAQLTYPGVYIEEIPSGVRTIMGVSTSVTAFVGYTKMGPLNKAQDVLSFADFERKFGGLSRDSPLSYAVQQFFLNGGERAIVVRVTEKNTASEARITLKSLAGSDVLDVFAKDPGEWANGITITVDYMTAHPQSTFNLSIQDMITGRSEFYIGLSMNPLSKRSAENVLKSASNIIDVEIKKAAFDSVAKKNGQSISGSPVNLSKLNKGCLQFMIILNENDGPRTVKIYDGNDINKPKTPDELRGLIENEVKKLGKTPAYIDFTCTYDVNKMGELILTSGDASIESFVRVTSADTLDAARVLGLGVANGGREIDAAAHIRPAPNGTLSGDLNNIVFKNIFSKKENKILVSIDGDGPHSISLFADGKDLLPNNLEELAKLLQSKIRAINAKQAGSACFMGTTCKILGSSIQILSGAEDKNSVIKIENDRVLKNLAAVSFFNQTIGWAVGEQAAILYTEDGGKEWSSCKSKEGVKEDLYGVSSIDASTATAVGERGTILLITGGGVTWTEKSMPNMAAGLRSVSFSGNKGWIVGENKIIYSKDKGETWVEITDITPTTFKANLMAISAVSDEAWAAGENGLIAKFTIDESNMKLKVETFSLKGVEFNLYGIHARSADDIWAVGENSTILHIVNDQLGKLTTNKINLPKGITSALRSVYFNAANEGWAVGDDSTVIKTKDTGTKWDPEPLPVGMYSNFCGIKYIDSSNIWIVGDLGTILKWDGALWSIQKAVIDNCANDLHLSDNIANVKSYTLGTGKTLAAQKGAKPGNDGSKPEDIDLVGNEAKKTGIYALLDVDIFNLLCLPEAEEVDTLVKAAAFCKQNRAFLIADCPTAWNNFDKALEDLGTFDPLRSENVALYFPRVVMSDPLEENRLKEFPPCGIIAGIFARTDSTRGVWKAPAGQDATLSGVNSLVYRLTDKENGLLNPLGVNCLRTFPIIGSVVWGARTLRGADVLTSEWKYIPIRRTALYIEESLFRALKWVVFEPNDEPLWAQIRLNVGAFMHDLFCKGAFQGGSPREAYFVKCDKDTTTQTDRDKGIVNILVGFAPLKPAEFVIIKIQQIAGQIQT
ncbi:MAG: YCF48-related protein [Methanothrix sp.]|nr:YCF48-related protein [Methanothrix sp.]